MFCHLVLGRVIFRPGERRPGREAMPLTLTSFSKICLQTLKQTLTKYIYQNFQMSLIKSISNHFQISISATLHLENLWWALFQALTLQALKYTLHFKHIPQTYWSQSTSVNYKHVLKVGDLHQCLLNTNLSILKWTQFSYTKNEVDPLMFSWFA